MNLHIMCVCVCVCVCGCVNICTCLTPSLAWLVKLLGWKMHSHRSEAPANSIFSGPVTHLLSMLCFLMKILSHASTKKEDEKA